MFFTAGQEVPRLYSDLGCDSDMAMKGGNPGNLRRPTSEEARIIGAKGGRASQQAQKRKKNLRELAVALLEADCLSPEQSAELTAMGLDASNGSAMLVAMFKRSLAGSERAAEFVRDTSGQAPKTQQQITFGDNMTPEDIRGLSDAELQRILEADGAHQSDT